jgi:hypothetical protein
LSIQSRVFETAFFQLDIFKRLSSASITGSKRLFMPMHFDISSVEAKNPTASPASAAAPRAVVSMHSGRIIFFPETSAWKERRKLFADAPPSTLKASIYVPISSSISSSTSQV